MDTDTDTDEDEDGDKNADEDENCGLATDAALCCFHMPHSLDAAQKYVHSSVLKRQLPRQQQQHQQQQQPGQQQQQHFSLACRDEYVYINNNYNNSGQSRCLAASFQLPAAASDEHVKMSLLCGLIAAIAAIDFQLKRQQHSFTLLPSLCFITAHNMD
ncbi:hypothetical protein ACLKA7_004470 [Drosophila subpalustris]